MKGTAGRPAGAVGGAPMGGVGRGATGGATGRGRPAGAAATGGAGCGATRGGGTGGVATAAPTPAAAGRATLGADAAIAGAGVCTAGRGSTAGAEGAPYAAAPLAAPANSARESAAPAMVITPPQIEQRARTLVPGTFAGSTRNTERHSGQVTFMPCPPPARRRTEGPRRVPPRLAGCRCGDPRNTPIPEASWRSSSFPLRVRSPGPHV